MASLRSMFLEANAQGIKYVVLNDDSSLPELMPYGEIDIRVLVEAADKKRFIKAFNLEPCYPMMKEKNELFTSAEPTHDSLKFRIIPKGKGYFPEQFESKLLIGRHVVNNCVYSPPQAEMIWMVLYEYMKRDQKLGRREFKIINTRLENYLGMITYDNPHPDHKKKYASSYDTLTGSAPNKAIESSTVEPITDVTREKR